MSSSELTVHLEKVPLPDGVTEYAFIRPRVERLEPRSRVYRQIVIRSSVRPEFDPWSMPEGEAEAFDPEDPTTWGPRMGWPEPVRLETPLVVRVVVGVGGRNGPGPFRSRNRGEFHAWQQLLQDEVLIP